MYTPYTLSETKKKEKPEVIMFALRDSYKYIINTKVEHFFC